MLLQWINMIGNCSLMQCFTHQCSARIAWLGNPNYSYINQFMSIKKFTAYWMQNCLSLVVMGMVLIMTYSILKKQPVLTVWKLYYYNSRLQSRRTPWTLDPQGREDAQTIAFMNIAGFYITLLLASKLVEIYIDAIQIGIYQYNTTEVVLLWIK